MPQNVTMKQLLEAGVHFGHQSRRWNPKMARYIFTERNGIYIIDLKKTLRLLREAMKFIRESIASGQKLLFVGTKKQARESVYNAATGCGMYYVHNRWLGGMLTNFKTIRHSIDRLLELEKMWEDGTINRYTKKEISMLDRERTSLAKNLSGVKNMKKLPDLIFVVDPHKEHIAVHEARKLNIPIVSIVDTNCDPDLIDYVIPGNDDAIRAIRLMCDQTKYACIEGLMEMQAIEGASPEGLTPEVAQALGLPVSEEQQAAAQSASPSAREESRESRPPRAGAPSRTPESPAPGTAPAAPQAPAQQESQPQTPATEQKPAAEASEEKKQPPQAGNAPEATESSN